MDANSALPKLRGLVDSTRISFAHEWLTNWAGSEQVLQAMMHAVPAHELHAAVVDQRIVAGKFGSAPIKPLWTSTLPLAKTHWSMYAPAMYAAWASRRIEADVLIVSSHFAAHAATRRFCGPSLVYYHTPARIVWETDMEIGRLPAIARSTLTRRALRTMRGIDRKVASHPTKVLANSSAVAERIRRAYGRTAEVVHPPVDVNKWRDVQENHPRYVVWLGRLVSYKKLDVAIEATRIARFKLLVIGDGPDRNLVETASADHVVLLGRLSDEAVADVLANSFALIMPGEEDFGIAPVEVLGAGVPVVSLNRGGARDYVINGVNGITVLDDSPTAFASALVEARKRDWDRENIKDSVARFSREEFQAKFVSKLIELI